MTTERQRQANRENSKKSTGPKTPEGKKTVGGNATTYGLHSRAPIIGGKIFNESQEEYEAFRDAALALHLTGNPIVDGIWQQLVDDMWRLNRLSAAEYSVNEKEKDAIRAEWESSRETEQKQAQRALDKLDGSTPESHLDELRRVSELNMRAGQESENNPFRTLLEDQQIVDRKSAMAAARAVVWRSPEGVAQFIALHDALRSTVAEQKHRAFMEAAPHYTHVLTPDMEHIIDDVETYVIALGTGGVTKEEQQKARLALTATLDVERPRLVQMQHQMEDELEAQLQEKLAAIVPFGERYDAVYDADQRIMNRINKQVTLLERLNKLPVSAPSGTAPNGQPVRKEGQGE